MKSKQPLSVKDLFLLSLYEAVASAPIPAPDTFKAFQELLVEIMDILEIETLVISKKIHKMLDVLSAACSSRIAHIINEVLLRVMVPIYVPLRVMCMHHVPRAFKSSSICWFAYVSMYCLLVFTKAIKGKAEQPHCQFLLTAAWSKSELLLFSHPL